MFKGTADFGTKNWGEEKKLLDQIEQLFEDYRDITDPDARKVHYAKIDKVDEVFGYEEYKQQVKG